MTLCRTLVISVIIFKPPTPILWAAGGCMFLTCSSVCACLGGGVLQPACQQLLVFLLFTVYIDDEECSVQECRVCDI